MTNVKLKYFVTSVQKAPINAICRQYVLYPDENNKQVNQP